MRMKAKQNELFAEILQQCAVKSYKLIFDVLKMLCAYLLTIIIYIYFLTILKQWNLHL